MEEDVASSESELESEEEEEARPKYPSSIMAGFSKPETKITQLQPTVQIRMRTEELAMESMPMQILPPPESSPPSVVVPQVNVPWSVLSDVELAANKVSSEGWVLSFFPL